MKNLHSSSVLVFAAILIPALNAWPTASYPEKEFYYWGSVKFPCGPNVENWVIDVGIGTPSQQFPMLIDTTTNISFVSGKQCTTDFCLAGNRFDYHKSTTIEDLHTEAVLVFSNEEESVKGKIYKDKFNLGDVTIDDMEFINVCNTTNLKPSGYAGSLALGFSDDALPDHKENQGQKYSKRYNSKRDRAKGIQPPGGVNGKRDNTIGDSTCSLDFGVNYDVIDGEIAWLDLPTCDFGDTPFWKTQLNGVKSGDCIDLPFKNTLASFDTSVRNIEVPKCDLDEIYKGLEATCAEGSTEYVFKCSKAKDLTFSFDKYDVTIPAESWIVHKEDNSELCTARISETDATDEPTNRWRLGTAFIRQVYSIYSLDRKQIGVALAVGGSKGVLIKPK